MSINEREEEVDIVPRVVVRGARVVRRFATITSVGGQLSSKHAAVKSRRKLFADDIKCSINAHHNKRKDDDTHAEWEGSFLHLATILHDMDINGVTSREFADSPLVRSTIRRNGMTLQMAK